MWGDARGLPLARVFAGSNRRVKTRPTRPAFLECGGLTPLWIAATCCPLGRGSRGRLGAMVKGLDLCRKGCQCRATGKKSGVKPPQSKYGAPAFVAVVGGNDYDDEHEGGRKGGPNRELRAV